MFRKRVQTKVIALFVVAFICLNAGGAMCVAYCQTFDMAEESGDHCPLKKKEHCDSHSDNPSFATLNDHGLDCCPMTVSFFAGPVEKTSFAFDATPVVMVSPISSTERRLAVIKVLDRPLSYRGPPPIDRRIDRIKNCIIRI